MIHTAVYGRDGKGSETYTAYILSNVAFKNAESSRHVENRADG